MTELEELRLAYAECSRQRFELLAKLKNLLQEPEPVAWLNDCEEIHFDKEDAFRYSNGFIQPLYTSPPKREWQGLTDDEIRQICDENFIMLGDYAVDFIESIQAKLKEKNT